MNYHKHLKNKLSFLSRRDEYDRFLFNGPQATRKQVRLGEHLIELPPQLGEHGYSVKHGLTHAEPKMRSRSWFIILATCCVISLMWWLSSNSRAYYEELPSLLSDDKTPAVTLKNLMEEPPSEIASTAIGDFSELAEEGGGFSDVASEIELETDNELLQSINGVLLEESTEPFSPWVDISVDQGDTLSTIFERHDLNKSQLYQLLASGDYNKRLERLKPEQTLRIKRDEAGNLEDLVLVLDFTQELHIYRKDETFVQEIRKREIENHLVYVHGCVDSSLYLDGQQAGLKSHQVLTLKNIFRNDFKLRNLKQGDQFTVVFQESIFEGETEAGDILAAEIIHSGKHYQAVRLTDSNDQRAEYYSPTAQGKKAFKTLTEQLNQGCQLQAYRSETEIPVTLGKTNLVWQTSTDRPNHIFLQETEDKQLISWIQPDLEQPKRPEPVVVAPPPAPSRSSNSNRNNNRPRSNDTNRGNRQTQPKLTNLPRRKWSPVKPLADERLEIVLASAHDLLGTPYKFGGTSPKTGFDCSGFVLYNMRKAGIQVPRTARQQFARTIPVKREDLKPGDLVFFRVRHRYIDHVGIYIGNDEFIHAESSRSPVNITSLNNSFYRKYYVGGGRHGG